MLRIVGWLGAKTRHILENILSSSDAAFTAKGSFAAEIGVLRWLHSGGEQGSTGQVEVEVACPGCQEAW